MRVGALWRKHSKEIVRDRYAFLRAFHQVDILRNNSEPDRVSTKLSIRIKELEYIKAKIANSPQTRMEEALQIAIKWAKHNLKVKENTIE